MDSRILVVTLIAICHVSSGERDRRAAACEQGSCYPATGDLLIGRERNLTSTSTCGLIRPERFCIVSHLQDDKKCFYCDSRYPYDRLRYPNSHRVQNIVSSFKRRKNTWWQAENGQGEVSLRLDLEAEFQFTHLVITFKTFRPAAMLIERSSDFGKTWKVYRYFADNCYKRWDGLTTGPIRNLTDIVCDQRYSDVAPSTLGEVIFRVLPPHVRIRDPYALEVQNLLKMTNLRVNFTQLHTLGDTLLDSRDEIKEKYYYSVYDMVVRGRCSCYGHASKCLPIHAVVQNSPDMVHGKCQCTHYTKGFNCEQCEDFYNDLPWRPARARQPNACKRCQCNRHATRCHFDPAVYESTGRISGGVCDDCEHNTSGRNCQECKPFFYQDPKLDITDPNICKRCDCDPRGSRYEGECEGKTDAGLGTVAGKCICKDNVDGFRCDQCKNGFWNLRKDNELGCDPCACDLLGTIGNFGCDKQTGICRCKRYVTGRACDQCIPGFWGMSEDLDGCKPCNCDIGGAKTEVCNQKDGTCDCYKNYMGRKCDTVRPGYFVPLMDYNPYEAEFARGFGNTQVRVREPVANRPITWTGPGFMRVTEGSALEFTINDIPQSMNYDLVIRYEPQMPDRWEDVRIKISRPDGDIDQDGVCANQIPQDDSKAASLGPASRHITVSPSSCLVAGATYTIRIEFPRYKTDKQTPDASILIDSIAFIPKTDAITIFRNPANERQKVEFERFRCRDYVNAPNKESIPEVCRKYYLSISASIHEKAFDCECDATGSTSSVCDPIGGHCPCKKNVVGRKCDRCAAGTYGFSPQGCEPCDCHATGSLDNFCDVQTGQCLCIPNAHGRTCGECQRGYYNFPNCRRCECNGHAETCDDRTGICHNCSDFTAGERCEKCLRGYYGDPRLGVDLPCRECKCPGGLNSGFQHAQTCQLDRRTGQVTCDCGRPYRGLRCEQCAENYYGNPNSPGGECQPCTCNKNIDFEVPGSCDARTGECKKCLFNTEGFNCERCRAGFYGDATIQSCRSCACDQLGTNRTAGPCDRVNGQCPCLPNVLGQQCDRCAVNHWNIASGKGCSACECDPRGSLAQQCNLIDGRCPCVVGRGGRTCSECETNYWGDPNVGCKDCQCNREGSTSLQCDRRTGQCECIKGVTGDKCDMCARGTTGTLPKCEPCGECFDNWDMTIVKLRNETHTLINRAQDIKITGATGAFEQEFKDMEKKVDQVMELLKAANISTTDLVDLDDQLKIINDNITESSKWVEEVQDRVREAIKDSDNINSTLENLQDRNTYIKDLAEELKNNASDVRDRDVEGAYNSIKESQKRSQDAQRLVDDADDKLKDSAATRKLTEDLLDQNKDNYYKSIDEIEKKLGDINDDVDDRTRDIVPLNDQVCDGAGDPCDSLCGGAGCGTCGGSACSDGAVTKADEADDFSMRAKKILEDKERKLRDMFDNLGMVKGSSDKAKTLASMTNNEAEVAKNVSQRGVDDLKELIIKISEFLDQKHAEPKNIRMVAEEVLDMHISLTPEEIRDLARQINETVGKLTNIEQILRDTRDDVARAKGLKNRADNAKDAADDIKRVAEKVTNSLGEARSAQDDAEAAIKNATKIISDTNTDLGMVEDESGQALTRSNEALTVLDDLSERLEAVKKRFKVNEINVKKAKEDADASNKIITDTELSATDVQTKYQEALRRLQEKIGTTEQARDRAELLNTKAEKLSQETNEKIVQLNLLDGVFNQNEQKVTTVSVEIEELHKRMDQYSVYIRQQAENYRTCSAT